jgi:tryptophanyl-tRNA synthetase
MSRVFSGIQPTGDKHIGNLLGAIRHWVDDQDRYECFYCIVDLHSVTVPREPGELRRSTLNLAAVLLGAGIDPERATLFVQSHVPEHTGLAWLLNCVATMGELRRMTQFKDKSGGQESVSVGLFDYPVLQAADVLLYGAERVPVGEDQRQHLELMRDIAVRFNARYGETFVVPEASIPRVGARIVDLQDPQRRMSTTNGTEAGTLLLLDPPARLRKKIMSAVTDSEASVRADPAKPGVTSLLETLAAVSGRTVAELERAYEGSGYGAFKRDVAEAVISYLGPLQARHAELIADPGELARLLARGAERAREHAVPMLERAHEAMGFVMPTLPRPGRVTV